MTRPERASTTFPPAGRNRADGEHLGLSWASSCPQPQMSPPIKVSAGARTAKVAQRVGGSESPIAHFLSKGDSFVAASLDAFTTFTDEMRSLFTERRASEEDEESTVRVCRRLL